MGCTNKLKINASDAPVSRNDVVSIALTSSVEFKLQPGNPSMNAIRDTLFGQARFGAVLEKAKILGGARRTTRIRRSCLQGIFSLTLDRVLQ
jgi:hypothetical protein